MSWQEKRGQVTERINQLVGRNPNAMSAEQLQELKQEYEQLLHETSSYLTQQAQNYQLSDKLEKTGTLQQQIRRLQEEAEHMKTDVETALARDELLRSRERTGNSHTLYLMDRPVRRGMVPYLWVLSVLFVGVGVLCFYWLTPMILPTGVNGQTGSIFTGIMDIFSSRLTWMALFGAASIVILFLSLKIAGVFGK